MMLFVKENKKNKFSFFLMEDSGLKTVFVKVLKHIFKLSFLLTKIQNLSSEMSGGTNEHKIVKTQRVVKQKKIHW